MNENTDKDIEKLTSLPEKIQGVILDDDYGLLVTAICAKEKVSVEQSLEVEDVVTDTILGNTRFENMPAKIASIPGVSQHGAEGIAHLVADLIFSYAEDELKQLYHIDKPLLELFPEPQGVPVPPPVPSAAFKTLMPPIANTPHIDQRETPSIFEEKLKRSVGEGSAVQPPDRLPTGDPYREAPSV